MLCCNFPFFSIKPHAFSSQTINIFSKLKTYPSLQVDIKLSWWTSICGQRNILAFGKSVVAPSTFRSFFAPLCGRSSREPPIIRGSLQHHVHNTKRTYRLGMSFLWWAEVDSNHRSRRRQIYSLIHLAALESAHMKLCGALWSRWLDSNPQPADYKSAALPIELHRRVFGALGRNWTTDRQIFSLLLYRLSYQGISGDPKRARTVDLQRDRLAL